MSREDQEAERKRVLEMIEIEERLGPVVSGGPARSSRKAVSVAMRARKNVRFVARSVRAPGKQAA